MREGLTEARVAGATGAFRGRGVEVLLDAAHNPAGARALASHLQEIGWSRVTLLFGAMRDKDVDRHARSTSDALRNDRVYDRAEPARDACGASSRSSPAAFAPTVEAIDDPATALERRARATHGRSSPPAPSFSSDPCVIFFADLRPRASPTRFMPRIIFILIVTVALEWFGAPAAARAQAQIAGCKVSKTLNMSGTKLAEEHYVMEGTADQPVQIDCDDLQFFADHMELFQKEGRVIANGNVTYISGGNRINAERMVYYTKTRTGTFYIATGTAVLRESAQPGIFGTQEPDAYFWGEELQKIGPKTYRIIKGGFTTCVQPAPRWDMAANSITLHLDDYALLKNAVFRVKNVPLMFLPIFYYPIQEDNRATGFLIPIYGSTTQRGQSITNQFFWAINRSHDATIEHDWFSKTGQQVGGEYRYVLAPGSQGNTRMSFLKEHSATTTNRRRFNR